MEKSVLRKRVIKNLKRKPKTERLKIEQAIVAHLLEADIWKEAQTVGITISKDYEWDTREIIEIAWKQGKRVVVPKSIPKEKRLDFIQICKWDDVTLGYYDIYEPKATATIQVKKQMIDLLIVPGLLFDKSGYRLGFGGGYYDRFLMDFPNNTLSLTGSKGIVDILPINEYDLPVDHLLTELGMFRSLLD